MTKRKKRGYWTKGKCIKEALKYKFRSKFKAGSGGAYNSCINNEWLDEVCSHMLVVGNKFKRLVYVYEFSDKSVYVGLTYNIEERDNKHKRDKRSSVFKHIKKTGINPKLTYCEYIDVDKAVILEKSTVEKYRGDGYNILNIADTGAIGGGNLKWTKEKCIKEAGKYKKRTKFARGSESAYNSARNNKWLDEVCSHMSKVNKKSKGYWTKEKCSEESLRYKTKKELEEKAPGAYAYMVRNSLLSELCPHMKSSKPNGYWTKERCTEEMLKCETKKEFREKNQSAYVYASKNNWLNGVF